jgi:hypothetical protein
VFANDAAAADMSLVVVVAVVVVTKVSSLLPPFPRFTSTIILCTDIDRKSNYIIYDIGDSNTIESI